MGNQAYKTQITNDNGICINIVVERIIVDGLEKIEIKDITGVPLRSNHGNDLPIVYLDGYPNLYAQNGKVVLRVNMSKTYYLKNSEVLRNIFTKEEWKEIRNGIKNSKERLQQITKDLELKHMAWEGVDTLSL